VRFRRLCAVGLIVVSGCALEEERAPTVGGDFSSRPFEEPREAPCADGETRSCSIELARNADIVSCFSGSQTCLAGEWSACGSSGGGTVESKSAVSVSQPSSGSSGVRPKSLSAPAELQGICATNPCDVTCRGFDETPPAVYTTTPVVSSWYANVSGFGGSPPGFISKLVREPCSAPVDCGYDQHCEPSTRKCVRNEPGWTYAAGVCGAANVTVGAACEVGGVITLPVCNRGNVTIPTGQTIKLAIKNGDWIRQPACPALSGSEINCSHALSAPLFPGACVTIDTCGYGGNAVAFVNADLAVAECPGTGTTLGCTDNWSDVKVVSCVQRTLTSYLPATFTQTYAATCPISTRPAWQLLTYSGSTASNQSGSSTLRIEAQTAPRLEGGAIGAYGPAVTVANTAMGDPAACGLTTASCPKNLFARLGEPAAYDASMKLTISLAPTPDALLPATLQNWKVSYSCVPNE